MNFRLFYILLTLAVLGFGGYWLYTNIPLFGFAIWNGNQWSLTETGWSIFTAGWVFFIPGVCVALAVMVPVQLWIYHTAKDADYETEIEALKREHSEKNSRMTQAVIAADHQARTAMLAAKQEFEAVTREAEQRTQEALRETQKAREIQNQAEQLVKYAKDEVEKASKNAQRATKKKNNAMASAERIKRREARLRASQEQKAV